MLILSFPLSYLLSSLYSLCVFHSHLFFTHSKSISFESLFPLRQMRPADKDSRGRHEHQQRNLPHKQQHQQQQQQRWFLTVHSSPGSQLRNGLLIRTSALSASSHCTAAHTGPWLQPVPWWKNTLKCLKNPREPLNPGATDTGHRRHRKVLVSLCVSLRSHLPGDRHGRDRCHLYLQHVASNQSRVPGAAHSWLCLAAGGSRLLEGPQGEKEGEERRSFLQCWAGHTMRCSYAYLDWQEADSYVF